MTASGRTTIRLLPFPNGPDPVDVAGDVRMLAERLDIDGGRTPAKVFNSVAELPTGWPNGAMAMVAPGISYEMIEGRWVMRDELPAFIMPVVPISHGNVGEGLTSSAAFFSLLRSPYNRIWRGAVYLGLTGHAAKGFIRCRIRRDSDNADMGITATSTYYAGDPFLFMAPFSFLKFANGPMENFRVWFEISGAGANTNISGGILYEGYATRMDTA